MIRDDFKEFILIWLFSTAVHPVSLISILILFSQQALKNGLFHQVFRKKSSSCFSHLLMPATCSADFPNIFSTNVHNSNGRYRNHNYGIRKYETVGVLCDKRPFAIILLLVLPSAGLGAYYKCTSAVSWMCCCEGTNSCATETVLIAVCTVRMDKKMQHKFLG
jgi:hypothetical protein